MVMKIRITEVSPLLDEVAELFKRLDEHNLSLCPPDVCHLTQPNELATTDSILLGVFANDQLVGTGGLKYFEDYAEVTRMFVLAEFRGYGLASRLMTKLESKALRRGVTRLKLETSDNFTAAVKLYEKLGFEKCTPFGVYIHTALNTYYQKKIS